VADALAAYRKARFLPVNTSTAYMYMYMYSYFTLLLATRLVIYPMRFQPGNLTGQFEVNIAAVLERSSSGDHSLLRLQATTNDVQ